jgi:hypothetical protein
MTAFGKQLLRKEVLAMANRLFGGALEELRTLQIPKLILHLLFLATRPNENESEFPVCQPNVSAIQPILVWNV